MKPYVIFRRAAVTLQRLQSTGLHFQVEPVTLKFLDCEDCLTITVIPLLPCKAQQAVARIRCFKRGLVATLFHPENRHGWAGREGQNSKVFGSCGPTRQAAEESCCRYVPAALLCSSSQEKKGLGGLQAGHSGTGEHIPAMALGTKRTPALPSGGSTEVGWEMPPERSPFKSVPHVPSAHPQEVSASLPSLWLFSSFGSRKRVISYVIFNGTSACA